MNAPMVSRLAISRLALALCLLALGSAPAVAQSPLGADTAPLEATAAAPQEGDNMATQEGGNMPLPPSIGIESPDAKEGGGIAPPSEEDPMSAGGDPLAWEEKASPAVPAENAVAPDMPITAPTDVTTEITPPTAPVDAKKTEAEKAVAENVAVQPANDMSARVEALEKEIAEIKASTKSDLEALRRSIDDLKSSGVAPRADAGAPAKAQPVKKQAKKKAAAKKPAPVWVLKSAKIGTAWVTQKGSSELRTVQVGDSLPGIGTIKMIGRDSTGGWVVSGTSGHINQK